jgi:hypothetical protein
MGHDSEDCGMIKSDFELYLTGIDLHVKFYTTIQNCPQLFK